MGNRLGHCDSHREVEGQDGGSSTWQDTTGLGWPKSSSMDLTKHKAFICSQTHIYASTDTLNPSCVLSFPALTLRKHQPFLCHYRQCFWTFLLLSHFNMVPHEWWPSNHKVIWLLPYNCNAATVMNCNGNICYSSYLIYHPKALQHTLLWIFSHSTSLIERSWSIRPSSLSYCWAFSHDVS